MRPRLRDFTPEQIRKISNGCGAKSGVIPVPQFLFKASCDKHDVLYIIGNTESDRRKADDAFYHYIKIDVANERSVFKRVWYSLIAYTYYKAVRLLVKNTSTTGR